MPKCYQSYIYLIYLLDIFSKLVFTIELKYLEEFERAFELIRQKVFDMFPDRVESLLSVYKRALATKKIIQDYLTESKLESGQKVVLVSHYTFLEMYATKWSGDVDSVTESDFEKQIALLKDQGVIVVLNWL